MVKLLAKRPPRQEIHTADAKVVNVLTKWSLLLFVAFVVFVVVQSGCRQN